MHDYAVDVVACVVEICDLEVGGEGDFDVAYWDGWDERRVVRNVVGWEMHD